MTILWRHQKNQQNKSEDTEALHTQGPICEKWQELD